jgi:hypothetical protein
LYKYRSRCRRIHQGAHQKNGIQRNQAKGKARRYVPGSNVPANTFDPNMRLLVLGMQQIGGGGPEAIVLGGMLDARQL